MTADALINGRRVHSDGLSIQHRNIICEGSWLKMAAIFDEPWLDLPAIENPDAIVTIVQDARLNADLFTFAQQLPDVTAKYSTYHLEWDNVAAAPASDFDSWWSSLPQESRKNVRRSQKRGVSVSPVEFNDELVRGIKSIYDETPYRQGRRFWHHGKTFDTVKQENSSYLERSQFIGAFFNQQLIGFLKMVYVGPTARIMQILSKNEHLDKNPTTALLAVAMEICSRRSVAHLLYGQYVYGNKHNSSVTEFKRRNGFQQVLLPRYYIPLTVKGNVALSLGLHRGLYRMLPEPVINFMLDTRAFVYETVSFRSKSAQRVK